MKPGNVIVTTNIEHREPVGNGRWNRYGFKAPKGRQFAFIYLGNLEDGVVTEDFLFETMSSLGWEPGEGSPLRQTWDEREGSTAAKRQER